MAGVILDPNGRRPPLEIIVPAHLAEERVKVGVCTVCAAKRAEQGEPPLKFYKGEEEAWQAHVGRCARANIDELRAASPSERAKGTIFDPADRDLELEKHFRGVADTMRREKRWTVRENERAAL